MGKFGCLPSNVKANIEDWEQDYANRVTKEVMHTIEMFCTPVQHGRTDRDPIAKHDLCDYALVKMICEKVRGITVDGALLKAARFLRDQHMPNCIIVCRDPAHIIRPSVRDPLHGADGFDKQHERLMGADGVLKFIQDSTQLKEQLVACQKKILEGGTMGGGVNHILRHAGFVQPRFESFVAPRRRYVCLLHAIAMLLVSKVGDDRVDSRMRRRCEEALFAMTVSDCFAAGLAGDYTDICMKFIRLFDVNDHDPSLTNKQLKDFLDMLTKLFQKGYVVAEVSCCNADTTQWKSLTEIAMNQVMVQKVFSYGTVSWPLWGADSVSISECKKHLASMSRVVTDVEGRLLAEFRSGDLLGSMLAFDLDSWSEALGAENDPACRRPQIRTLIGCVTVLCEKLRVKISTRHWTQAARNVLELRTRLLRESADSALDNRLVWSKALDCHVLKGGDWTWVINFFKAFWDGTGAVERGLGKDKHNQRPHSGKRGESDENSHLYAMLAELHDEGPRREQDVFQKKEDGVLLLTDFSRACARQWVLERGRRFCTYKKRSHCVQEKQVPLIQKGTDAYVKLGAGKAQKERQLLATIDLALPIADRPARPTLLGDKLSHLMRRVHLTTVPEPSKPLQDFRKSTARKLAAKAAVGVWSGFAKVAPPLRLGGSALVAHAQSQSAARQCLRASLWRRGGRKPAASASTPGDYENLKKRAALSLRPGKKLKVNGIAPRVKAIHVDEPFEAVCQQSGSALHESVLNKWLEVIAHGSTTIDPQGNSQKHVAAFGTRWQFYAHHGFKKKHANIFHKMTQISERPNSNWTIHNTLPTKSCQKKLIQIIGKLEDFRNALVRMRRVPLKV